MRSLQYISIELFSSKHMIVLVLARTNIHICSQLYVFCSYKYRDLPIATTVEQPGLKHCVSVATIAAIGIVDRLLACLTLRQQVQ